MQTPVPVSRRHFLGSAVAISGLASSSVASVLAEELQRQGKHVILLWLAGGASQLETWDPKPGRPTGGPFQAIQTSVPGIMISELMPRTAQRLKHIAILRSLNTKDGDHGGAARLMHLGRRDEPTVKYPDLGAIVAKELGQPQSQVPDYVSFYTATEGRGSSLGQAGFLGARYQPMSLTTEIVPPNLKRLDQISEIDHRQRGELREALSQRFVRGRESAVVGSHREAYLRVPGLMASERLFDASQEPASMQERYGPTLFGQQVLVARRLIEAGVPFVKVSRAWWDSHGQNFETHLELVSELDHVYAALLDDLEQRGLLQQTLVVTLSEFGRTPAINASLGRDHFASAWSCSLAGCGIRGGSVFGKTDDDGHTVVEGQIGAGELFATIFQALGIDHQKNYYVGSRPIPLTNPGTQPISSILV